MAQKFTKLNIVLEKYEEADDFFNPTQFLEKFDNEKYFEHLVDWKEKNEKEYLEKKPWLNRVPIIMQVDKKDNKKIGYFLIFVFLESLSCCRYFLF